MLMMGTGVLFNSAKMLKMGVYVVFMHDYGHQETQRDITQLVYPRLHTGSGRNNE